MHHIANPADVVLDFVVRTCPAQLQNEDGDKLGSLLVELYMYAP